MCIRDRDTTNANTGAGDDTVRIHAHANGDTNVAWALRDSSLATGTGDDDVEISGNALRSAILTGDGLDTIRISGLETDEVHIDSGANDDMLRVDGGTQISFVSGAGSDQLQLTRNYFTSLVEAETAAGDRLDSETPIAEELSFEHSETSLGAHRDALKFEDFTTGAGGDSLNIDDILIGHGVDLQRDSLFADGVLSFQQQGHDSVLFFDADGTDNQATSERALVVFKGVQASEFSSDNLDSTLIQHDDFSLHQALLPTAMPALVAETEADPISGLGEDHAMGSSLDQAASIII